ncbi:hypothetical protein AAIH25_01485 [Arthrobacter crystallopoietes]|uniref:hypothetical protein n=1 Tax=Crystallibacter crystallopoietes TaxID=37928 RepID=UPI003D1F70EC
MARVTQFVDDYLVGAIVRVAALSQDDLEKLRSISSHLQDNDGENKATEREKFNSVGQRLRSLEPLLMRDARPGWQLRLQMVDQAPQSISQIPVDIALELLSVVYSSQHLTVEDRNERMTNGVFKALIDRIICFVQDARSFGNDELVGPQCTERDFGDSWVRASGRLFSSIHGERPIYPTLPAAGKISGPTAVPYWHGLFLLTYAALAWCRPEVGLARWISQGMNDEEPVLKVLKRSWGLDAMALAFENNRNELEDYFFPEVRAEFRPAATRHISADVFKESIVMRQPHWGAVFMGGWDPMHSMAHLREHMWWPTDNAPVLLSTAIESSQEAHLLLDRFEGWYESLMVHGERLQRLSNAQSWKVHVTVKPLGYLGRFRQSSVTGLWFQSRHRTHMLGNA